VSVAAHRPRRWSETVDGIVWLPRMIDKARMQQQGRLGIYLLGHSPVDASLMKRLNVTTAEFETIASAAADDAAVLAALRQHGFDEARVQRWSGRFPRTFRWFISVWDVDEGYIKPNLMNRIGLLFIRALERPTSALVRTFRRAP
jgi:hypothetical protein